MDTSTFATLHKIYYQGGSLEAINEVLPWTLGKFTEVFSLSDAQLSTDSGLVQATGTDRLMKVMFIVCSTNDYITFLSHYSYNTTRNIVDACFAVTYQLISYNASQRKKASNYYKLALRSLYRADRDNYKLYLSDRELKAWVREAFLYESVLHDDEEVFFHALNKKKDTENVIVEASAEAGTTKYVLLSSNSEDDLIIGSAKDMQQLEIVVKVMIARYGNNLNDIMSKALTALSTHRVNLLLGTTVAQKSMLNVVQTFYLLGLSKEELKATAKKCPFLYLYDTWESNIVENV